MGRGRRNAARPLQLVVSDRAILKAGNAYRERVILPDTLNNEIPAARGAPTDHPMIGALNGWMKKGPYPHFDLPHTNDVPALRDASIPIFLPLPRVTKALFRLTDVYCLPEHPGRSAWGRKTTSSRCLGTKSPPQA